MISLLSNLKILNKIQNDFGIIFRGQKFDPDPWSNNFKKDDYFEDQDSKYGTLKHQSESHVLTLKCSGNELSYLFKLNWDENLNKFKDSFKGRVKSFEELYKVIQKVKKASII